MYDSVLDAHTVPLLKCTMLEPKNAHGPIFEGSLNGSILPLLNYVLQLESLINARQYC
jgi:hypothetical protein